MAIGYRAATRIKYGDPGGVVREFAAGDPVVGLSKEAMRDLWDAEALEEYDTSEENEMSEEPMAEAAEEVAEGTEAAEEAAGGTEEAAEEATEGTEAPAEG